MLKLRTPLRRLLPALALLGSCALTSCWEKEAEAKPRAQHAAPQYTSSSQPGGTHCGSSTSSTSSTGTSSTGTP